MYICKFISTIPIQNLIYCRVQCSVGQCAVCTVVQSVGSGKYNIYLGAKVYLFEIDKHVVNISQEGSFLSCLQIACVGYRVQRINCMIYGVGLCSVAQGVDCRVVQCRVRSVGCRVVQCIVQTVQFSVEYSAIIQHIVLRQGCVCYI